jgi:hypothetical protein
MYAWMDIPSKITGWIHVDKKAFSFRRVECCAYFFSVGWSLTAKSWNNNFEFKGKLA